MAHHITADHLVDAATKAVTEELFRNFNNTLQSFCDEERDRVVLFRTLRSTRIRLSILRKYLLDEEVGPNKTRGRFLDIAIGYINTELELLRRYDRIRDLHTKTPHRWTGTIVELVELIYGLQELHCIDEGEAPINELIAFFNSSFGLEVKESHCYNAYADMKRRKNDSRTYFLDKMRERLNLRMQRDEEKERARRR
ncbi:RteC domain-containing protein [Alistipes indistinctus]|uniref:RteC domain-containing protein n=1 Tax=Alistipes indistinctus TaxID=626932 RepID=UPI003A858C1C